MTDGSSVATAQQPFLPRLALRRPSLSTATIVAIFAVIVLVGSLTTTGFATVENFKAILQSSAFVGIIAVGMTVIMLSGNVFSMSLGTTAAVTAITFLWALAYGIGRRSCLPFCSASRSALSRAGSSARSARIRSSSRSQPESSRPAPLSRSRAEQRSTPHATRRTRGSRTEPGAFPSPSSSSSS
jgi:hypothetical protein